MLASDSNLSTRSSNAGFGQKVFPIPHLNSALAYTGSYSIGGKDAFDYLNEFIINSSLYTPNLEDFVNQLSGRLTSDFRDFELKHPTIIHLAGYQRIDFKSYLQHWHISNTGLNSLTGQYDVMFDEFHIGEDFNSQRRSNDRKLIKEVFPKHALNNKFFINGFAPGRIAARGIIAQMEQLLFQVWQTSDWKFRPPSNIFEVANILRLNLNYVCELFKVSDYPALYVGGEIQTYLIPAPADLDLSDIMSTE